MFVAMTAITGLTVAALMSDLVSRQEVEASLRSQALHDNLTGLPNRRLLFDRLDSASRRLARSPGSIALLFVDLDRFKAVNDTFGHAAGDALLVGMAHRPPRLESVLRSEDTVARLGGDEFLILTESPSSDEERRALARRARAAVAHPFVWQGHTMQIDASVGIASTDTPLADAQELVAMADGAMYRAKHGDALPVPA